MIGNAHDIPDDHRRQKAHFNRAFLKSMGWYDLSSRHRRRAFRKRMKVAAFEVSHKS